MTASEQLRTLVRKATKGPWEMAIEKGSDDRGEDVYEAVIRGASGPSEGHVTDVFSRRKTDALRDANARLIALAPQLAELLADMGDFVRRDEGNSGRDELLARFDALFTKETA